MRRGSESFRILRKAPVAARCDAEREHLRFEFSDVAAHADELLVILPAFRCKLFDVIILGSCRDFEVAVLSFEFLYASAIVSVPART